MASKKATSAKSTKDAVKKKSAAGKAAATPDGADAGTKGTGSAGKAAPAAKKKK